MLNLIQDNPYRYLGVCSNSSARERIANINRLNAYLKVGKEVKFPSDLEQILPMLSRTLEGANAANSKINLPNDQLKYALFWFVNVTPLDKMALDYLWMGNVEKSCEIFGKKETYSSLINRGVLSFLQNDYASAVCNITLVIHNESYRTQFVDAVCGNTFQISEEELSEMFINALLEEIDAVKLSPIFEQSGCSQKDCALIKEKSTAGLIASINAAIEIAKGIDKNAASLQLQAGKQLITSTKSDLSTLCSVLGGNDMQYQMIADRLANQILQCGINYYNKTDEDDEVSIDKALNVQKYAFKIAVGKLAKDRCRENCKILEDKKANLPPEQVSKEVKEILKALKSCDKMNDDINTAEWLIGETKPHLNAMKGKLFASNEFYLKISSIVVHRALHNIIEEVNNVQSQSKNIIGIAESVSQLRIVFDEAIKAMNSLGSFDMDEECHSRYTTNKNTLIILKNQIDGISYASSSRSGSSYKSSSSSDPLGDFLEENSGCLIEIVIFIIVVICIASC